MNTAHPMSTALLVPLRSFSSAKTRLDPHLSGSEREALARSMAETVVDAGRSLATWIVCDEAEVSAWAITRSLIVIWRGGGLNGAVQQAAEYLESRGVARLIVAHGDLPNAESFAALRGDDDIAVRIVTDHDSDGSNVLSIPLAHGFEFAYGAGSFEHHRVEAARRDLPFVVVDEPALALDIDTAEDLARLRAGGGAGL